jgi:hypothetical protein
MTVQTLRHTGYEQTNSVMRNKGEARIPGARSPWRLDFERWRLSTEIVPCHVPGDYNFKVASKYLEHGALLA